MRFLKALLSVFTLAAVLLIAPQTAAAQTNVVPADRLGFDQPAASIAEAAGLTYRAYVDGSASGIALSAVTCSAAIASTPAGSFPCVGDFPAVTPGSHAIRLTAGNAAGESLQSTPFAFAYVVVPSAPLNLRRSN